MIEIDDLSSPLLLLACLAALVMVGLVALHGAADSARRRRRRGPLAEFAPYAGAGPAHLPHAESLPSGHDPGVPGREAGPRNTQDAGARS